MERGRAKADEACMARVAGVSVEGLSMLWRLACTAPDASLQGLPERALLQYSMSDTVSGSHRPLPRCHRGVGIFADGMT